MDKNFMIKLNKLFLKKAKEFVEENKPMNELFNFYRKYLKEENEEKKINFSDKEDVPLHFIQSSDDEISEKNKSIAFKNCKKEEVIKHKCSETEIYKFLVEYFGYFCPCTVPSAKKKKILKKEVECEEFTWPFLEPPKKPRTVFDNGPTREEIGEYNRRIFAAYTEYLNYENDVIPYDYNPNFIDEDEDENFCKNHLDHQFKAEIECYLYNGNDYIYQDKGIIRISKDLEGNNKFSLQAKKYNIETILDNFKLYYIEHDGKVDMLNMEDLTITRLLFNNEVHSRQFYEYFDVPCE